MTCPRHVLSLCSSALAVVIVFGVTALADDPPPDDQARFVAIDRYVTAKVRSSHIPGLALAIVEGDRIVALKSYGAADSSGRPITPQTPFVIGSITKSFTALAIMQLVEAGQVDLDAPVQHYLPWFRVVDPVASSRITVRHLLTMTSGLPQLYATQQWTDRDSGALERAVRYLERVELSRPIGTFGYSNANFDTLGLIVQYVSGRSYGDYVKQHIFAPLDMRNSFVSQDEARRSGMATGHRWWFGIPVAVTLPLNQAELPAGYLLSGAEDMSHFLIAQVNGGSYRRVSILSPEGIRLTHSQPGGLGTYGFGWELIRDDGRMLINHDGGTPNFQSSIFFDPDARIGVFLAANVVSGLDALSSPPGSSPLDGLTVRAMAMSVLNLASSRPLPAQGRGHTRVTVIANSIVLLLSVALVLSLWRLPTHRRRMEERGIASGSLLLWHLGVATVLNFTVPVVVLSLALLAPWWSLFASFQPDLACWLYVVATVLLCRGLFETATIWTVFRDAR